MKKFQVTIKKKIYTPRDVENLAVALLALSDDYMLVEDTCEDLIYQVSSSDYDTRAILCMSKHNMWKAVKI